jgi:hypothetical protein
MDGWWRGRWCGLWLIDTGVGGDRRGRLQVVYVSWGLVGFRSIETTGPNNKRLTRPHPVPQTQQEGARTPGRPERGAAPAVPGRGDGAERLRQVHAHPFARQVLHGPVPLGRAGPRHGGVREAEARHLLRVPRRRPVRHARPRCVGCSVRSVLISGSGGGGGGRVGVGRGLAVLFIEV